MGRSYRPKMLGEEIKKIISDMLIRGAIKDPAFRNKMVGINEVEVSGDGSYATLYITVLSYTPGKEFTDAEKKDLLKAFDKCKGFLRTEIGKQIKVRHVPELIFKFDTSFEYGMKMDRLIDSLNISHDDDEEDEEGFEE